MQSQAKRVDISEPAMLIRIPRLYRPGMSDVSLYEATRAAWVVGPRRDGADLALAVVRGIVLEVYEVDRWQPAGTARYKDRWPDASWRERWEFVGRVAAEPVRSKYRGGSVAHYFPAATAVPFATSTVSSRRRTFAPDLLDDVPAAEGAEPLSRDAARALVEAPTDPG